MKMSKEQRKLEYKTTYLNLVDNVISSLQDCRRLMILSDILGLENNIIEFSDIMKDFQKMYTKLQDLNIKKDSNDYKGDIWSKDEYASLDPDINPAGRRGSFDIIDNQNDLNATLYFQIDEDGTYYYEWTNNHKGKGAAAERTEAIINHQSFTDYIIESAEENDFDVEYLNLLEYVKRALEDYEYEIKVAIKRMDRQRCGLDYASPEIYGIVMDAIDEYATDNEGYTDGNNEIDTYELFGKDIEDIFWDAIND